MIVDMKCGECNKHHAISIEQNAMCFDCFKDKCIPSRATRIKECSYELIIPCILYAIISFQFGWKIQLLCAGCFIFGQFFRTIVKWLMKIF